MDVEEGFQMYLEFVVQLWETFLAEEIKHNYLSWDFDIAGDEDIKFIDKLGYFIRGYLI